MKVPQAEVSSLLYALMAHVDSVMKILREIPINSTARLLQVILLSSERNTK
jgi:hypothetical protein